LNADLLRARRNAEGLQSLLGENLKTVSLERTKEKMALGGEEVGICSSASGMLLPLLGRDEGLLAIDQGYEDGEGKRQCKW
jgi:hypothetical protein